MISTLVVWGRFSIREYTSPRKYPAVNYCYDFPTMSVRLPLDMYRQKVLG